MQVLSNRTEELGLDHIRRVGGCSNPVQLTADGLRVNESTGEITSPWSTDSIPGGVAYVACKTRHSSRCESCAWLYQGDAYQLIVAGLRGGKETAEEVANHPALFLTLTAPSFGKVHSQRKNADDRHVNVCTKAARQTKCKHGNAVGCSAKHRDGDPALGQPLCPRCYDYVGAVLWNNACSELWRRTRIALDRVLAKQLKVARTRLKDHLRIQYVKVAEFQQRGLIHFHIGMRLDGPTPAEDPPITETELRKALEIAIKTTKAPVVIGKGARWGSQFKIIRIVPDSDIEQEDEKRLLTRGRAAGYLGKYSTKDASGNAALDRRIYSEDQLRKLKINAHQLRMVKTAWQLDIDHPELRTRAWSHQFGYRGHFMTKSGKWSTTFSELRQARRDHQDEERRKNGPRSDEREIITIHARWSYAGIGYLRPEDTWIAQQLTKRRTRKEAA